ncbi:sodium/proline symporter [Colwellia sp. UCD-KL20]|uniref:sodium/proline symporter n=1 Tax=Colwellia sp. UCD-KL20 TaxID=1917165 RepID=UPI000970641F|nr:sodium/proline symporter [Colwellia sp. UCD-KL20]
MTREFVILTTLLVYKLLLIAIGLWASKRTKSTEDFFIGGKTLGPWVAAISSSASASSAWSLLGVSGAAYTMGYSAIWLFPAVVGGYIFNWFWLAPKVYKISIKTNAVTLTELLAGKGSWAKPIVWLCSFAIIFSFSFYIAAQFQAAGGTFASSFNMDASQAIILGTLIILIYTLLGGFWAVSVTDTLQGSLMALTAIVLPTAAIIQVGGFSEIYSGLHTQFTPQQLSFTGEHTGWMAFAFVLGMLGIGLGNPGQPHVINRFMALKDKQSIKTATYIGIGWPIIVYGGMLILGLCARILVPNAENNEQILFGVTALLFHPVVAGIIIAAVLSAIMSTADSQLLVAASSLSYDIKKDLSAKASLLLSRLAVFVMCVVSMLIALYAPEAIFSRVLFAWAAIGSAFAPLLVVLLLGTPIKGAYRFFAILSGFTLTVYLSWQENTPGDIVERVLPFILAFSIAYLGRENVTR